MISIEDQETIPAILRIIKSCGLVPGTSTGANIDVKTIIAKNLFEIFIFKNTERKVLGLFPVKELKNIGYLYIPEWTLHAPVYSSEIFNLVKQISISSNRHILLVNG